MFSLYSKKYSYILHCVPKSGCTYLRTLFLELHHDESSTSSINDLECLIADNLSDSDISTLQSVLVLRDPYHRLVSGWIDKIVLRPSEGIQKILIPEFETYLGEKPFLNATLEDFSSFLLNRGQIETIDPHFSVQVPLSWRYKPTAIINLKNVDDGLYKFYKTGPKELLEKYLTAIKNYQPNNASAFNSDQEYPIKPFSASTLTIDHLYGLAQMDLLPPKDWFFSEHVINCVHKIYRSDFSYLKFDKPKIMVETTYTKNNGNNLWERFKSSEQKLSLNPAIEKMLITAWEAHHPILHKGQLPEDFCPSCYLELNPDVSEAGIDPLEHFVSSGIFEKRRYKNTLNGCNYCTHQVTL